jgi:hypothetical protein
MQIRRTLFAGAAAGMAALAVLSTATAAGASPAAKHHVLTIGKAGGAAVKTGAKLSASLAKGTKAVFSNSLGTLSCTKSSFTAKVTKNPTARGTADESTTKQSVSGCTITTSGVTVTSVTVNNLPYKSTVSDKKGDPVTVSKAQTTIVLLAGTTTVTCVYTDKLIKGSASNKHQTIAFKNQVFTLDTALSNPASDCELGGTSGKFTATYGPVKDTSVKHDPKVYVN